jgi:hypothetical protein
MKINPICFAFLLFAHAQWSNAALIRVTDLPNGQQANARGTTGVSFSENGRYLIYSSSASNLVANDTNGALDTFRRDLQTGHVECVSCSATGTISQFGVLIGSDLSSSAITADGAEVVFVARAEGLLDMPLGTDAITMIKNMRTGQIEIASRASGIDGAIGLGSNSNARVTSSGRFVMFLSRAANLVANDTNAVNDVFIRDRSNATTTRASVSSSGTQGTGGGLVVTLGALEAQISDNGRYVLMRTLHRRLVPEDLDNQFDCYLRDQWNGTTVRLGNSPVVFPVPAQPCYSIALAGNGSLLAIEHADPGISPSPISAAWSIFYRSPSGGSLQRLDRPDGTPFPQISQRPSIDARGQQLAFASFAAGIVPGDTNGVGHVYVYDLASREFKLVSRDVDGNVSNLFSSDAQISPVGGMVAFIAGPPGASNQADQYLYIPDTPSANTPSGTYTQAFVSNQTQWQLDFIGPPGTVLSCAFEAPSSVFSMPNSNTALPGQIVVNALAPGRVMLLCSSGNTLIARYELQATVAMQVPGLRGIGVMVLVLFVLGLGAAFAGRR